MTAWRGSPGPWSRGLAAPAENGGAPARTARRPRPRRRYHFHAAGFLYIAVSMFLAVGALNSQNNLLFAALGLAIGGLVISGLLSGASLMGIRVERHEIGESGVGAPLVIVYSVRNANRWIPAFGLHVEEAEGTGADWPSYFSNPPAAFVAHVGPGQGLHCEAIAWAARRGRPRFAAVRVWSTFPFGIARKSVTFYQPQAALVRPLVIPLIPRALESRGGRSDRGAAADRLAGSGEEFYGLREYIPGDVPRDIAWRASARTGQLLVTQRAAPVPLRAWIVLRFAAGGRTAAGDERAIALAASLVRRAVDSGIAVGLAIPQTGLLRAPERNRWHVERLMDDLGLLDAAPLGAPAPFPAHAGRASSCFVVHAGEPDETCGPAHARHFSEADLPGLAAEGAGAVRVLAGPAPAPTIAERLRAAARDAIGQFAPPAARSAS